jgi:hypothetical protein
VPFDEEISQPHQPESEVDEVGQGRGKRHLSKRDVLLHVAVSESAV